MLKKINIDEVDKASQDLKDLALQFAWFDDGLFDFSNTVSGVCVMLGNCVKNNENGHPTYVSVLDNKEYDFVASEVNRLIGVAHMQKYLAVYELTDYLKQLCDCEVKTSVWVRDCHKEYATILDNDSFDFEAIIPSSTCYVLTINSNGITTKISVERESAVFSINMIDTDNTHIFSECYDYDETDGLEFAKRHIYNLLTP